MKRVITHPFQRRIMDLLLNRTPSELHPPFHAILLFEHSVRVRIGVERGGHPWGWRAYRGNRII